MKIIVEFLRAEQHWLPDTGEQQNYLVFGFGGLEHRIPCEEADIIQSIREAQGVAVAEAPSQPIRAQRSFVPEEELEDSMPDELEQEFERSNEPVANPPVMFENPEAAMRPAPPKSAVDERKDLIAKSLDGRPRTKEKILAEKEARKREIARRAPVRSVPQDEVGNPIVPDAQRVAGPSPTIRRIGREETQDDDKFQQG